MMAITISLSRFLAYPTGLFLLDTCSNGLSLTAGSERKAQLPAELRRGPSRVVNVADYDKVP